MARFIFYRVQISILIVLGIRSEFVRRGHELSALLKECDFSCSEIQQAIINRKECYGSEDKIA